MTHPHDDTAPAEHDPTGMRDLLASLPDPGPMPDDLVARISAALAGEVALPGRRRARPPPRRAAAPRHPAAPPRGRRGRRHRRWGLVGTPPAASSGSEADGLHRGRVRRRRRGGGTGAVRLRGPGRSGRGDRPGRRRHVGRRPRVRAARRDRTRGRRPSRAPRRPRRRVPRLGPVGTPIGARSCADALGVPPTAGLLVDVAEVDGSPAAVLVVHDEAGRTAYAVDRSCTTGTTGLIRGPVALDG